MANSQLSGNDSTNLQAGRDIVVNQSVVLCSTEELAKQLMLSVFVELPLETKKQIENNHQSYFGALSENLKEVYKQKEELKKVIDSPDFQYVSKNAVISASRSSSSELHRNLSTLIAKRINNDHDDLKRIVYDEAIITVDKLTRDQLQIMALCYLLRDTSYSGIVSWETYEKYLDLHIKPFLGFKSTVAEFQHIQYTGCGTLSARPWDIVWNHKELYSFLFANAIPKSLIDSLNLPSEVKNEIIIADPHADSYLVSCKNKAELEQNLKEKSVDENIAKQLVSIYLQYIKNNYEVLAKIRDETATGKEMLEVVERSPLKHLILTSVGTAIAANYVEQIVGEKIDITIWIN